MQNWRPRVLILKGRVCGDLPIAETLSNVFDVDVVQTTTEALDALRGRDYQAVFSDAGDFLPLERGLVGEKASLVLNTIGEGACVVDLQGRMNWCNKQMRHFAPEVQEKVKQVCSQAQHIFNKQTSQLPDSGKQLRTKKYTFQDGERYFELMVSPVIDRNDEVNQVVAVVWDASSGRRLQRKIDAIDAAGRELARIESEAIRKLSPGERLKLLQDKIIKYSKDLMHFDHFAIRLLNKRTNKLEMVIAEGLPAEALEIDLYAVPEGNGISGYVAATGRSYICHDTEKDPRYVLGLTHCKSSLTVPLNLFGETIGVYNVEADEIGAFTEDDRQFAEIFARYVALTLNILDLLVTERSFVNRKVTENVVSELAEPIDDICANAQSLIEDYIGEDVMRGRLNRILECAEEMRATMDDVKAGPRAIRRKSRGEPEQKSAGLDGKRILIADDEANIRNTIADILTRQGCECEVCKDGYEATTLLEQRAFDLVLSDIKMPYRNGYEIFAAAKRANEELPVLLMTGFGYDPHHSIVRASQEGLASVLFKPFEVANLLLEIRKALGVEQPDDETEVDEQVSEPTEATSSERGDDEH